MGLWDSLSTEIIRHPPRSALLSSAALRVEGSSPVPHAQRIQGPPVSRSVWAWGELGSGFRAQGLGYGVSGSGLGFRASGPWLGFTVEAEKLETQQPQS